MLDDETKGLIKASTEGLAKGIISEIPIYKDLLQPGVQEVGKGVGAAVKIAMSPFTGLVWGFEKIYNWLEPELERRLKDIAREDIITPSPIIVGPAIEALRFLEFENNLRHLFANLMATSMTRQKADEAHPGFIEIIKNLSGEDAKVLSWFFENHSLLYGEIWTKSDNNKRRYLERIELNHLLQDFPEGLAYDGINSITNLKRLGLIEPAQGTLIEPEFVHNVVFNEEQHDIFKTSDFDDQYIVDVLELEITMFGSTFCQACL